MTTALRRSVAWGMAALWAVLAAHAVARRVGYLADSLGTAFASAAQRQEIESGDPAYHRFLIQTQAQVGGAPRLLVLVHDPARNDLFQDYRAAYVRFPQRIWYVPVGDLSASRRRFSIHAGAELAAIVRDQAIGHVAYYHRPDPGRSRWFTVRPGQGDELFFEDLGAAMPAAPAAPIRFWAWVLGVLSLFALGLTGSAAIGLDPAFRQDRWARLGIGFMTGTGLTAWMMELLFFGHVPWSPVAVWLCWLPVAALGVWRLSRMEATGVAPAATPPAEDSTWHAHVVRGGPWLVGLAVLLPSVQVLIPVSAWSNWDAWAVWALKAKACLEVRGLPLAFLGESQYHFSHPDYPLGVPAVQTYLELLAGGANEHGLRLLPLAYAVSLTGLLLGALKDLGVGKIRWALCGAFMLTPKIQEFSSIGYQDLPAAGHMASCLCVLVKVWQGRAPGWTVGVLGGLAALVKDEGLVWGAGGILTVGAWVLQRRVDRRQVAGALLAMAVLAGPWKAVVHHLGLKPNDYAVEPGRMLALLPDRLPLVVSAFVHEGLGAGATVPAITGAADLEPGAWYEHLLGSWNVLWYGCALALLLGWRGMLRGPLRELGIPLVVQAAAYTGVFLASTWDLPVHLVTTVDRLLLQLSPAVFLLAAGAWSASRAPIDPVDTKATPLRGRPGRAR